MFVRRLASGGVYHDIIIIPETQYHDKRWCEVLAIGVGKRQANGSYVKLHPELKVGDLVFVHTFDADKNATSNPSEEFVDANSVQVCITKEDAAKLDLKQLF